MNFVFLEVEFDLMKIELFFKKKSWGYKLCL